MDSSARFRRYFAHRLASAVGLSTLVLPVMYACSGKAVVDGSSGSGGASNSSSNSSSSSSSSNQTSGAGGALTTSGAGGDDKLCSESSTTAAGGPNPTYHYVMCLDELNTPCPSDEMTAFDTIRQVLQDDCCIDNFESCEDLRSVDCGPFDASGGNCCFEITTEEIFCAVPGRPFSDCGDALLAELTDDDAWLAVVDGIETSSLSSSERTRLADKWSRDALAEHASVASFARFALQLMAVGAPAALVAAAQEAALDEVEHARLAFAVASAYAGRDVGPGAFPVPSTPFATSLVALAVATAEEGCINETLCTIEARAELDATSDPAVRGVLARIIEDETRHAELAWRTVAWAVAVGGDEVREAVAAVFAPAATSGRPGVRDVVAPVARALLAA